MNWLKESNRQKHLLFGIPVGLIFTILCVLGVAAGLEFKDKQYGNIWDWKDFWATMLGGFIGQLIQIMIILAII